jgi:hypothetical protein
MLSAGQREGGQNEKNLAADKVLRALGYLAPAGLLRRVKRDQVAAGRLPRSTITKRKHLVGFPNCARTAILRDHRSRAERHSP